MTPGRRRAGVMVPLFSCPSSASWGMGEIPDLVPLARWLAAGGVRVLQILPLNEMALTEQSPYSALSGMAIDPLYLAVPAIPDFAAAGGERGLESDVRDALARLRASARVDYTGARFVKRAALSAAFEAFHEVEWRRDTARAEDCRAFVAREAWWLADYALFRALHDREAHRPWTEWPAALRQRNPHALDAARHELAREVLFYQYLQWTADGQWRQARAEARAAGVALFGDLPFLVDGHSADVWARAEEFDLDVSVGVPPDAFSAEGQDWGMPMPRWEVMAEGDYQWLRARARRHADLFSGYRVDHLVGLYRTFGRPRDKKREAFFSPATEPEQRAQGEHLLALLEDTGAEIIAEDLGTVPDFVRASLARLRIPGYRVLRWEREWQADGQPFRDPAEYPACSVATTGTHDTEPLAEWWTAAPREERIAASRIPSLQRVAGGADLADQPWDARVRDAFLETLYGSGADLTLLPLGDIFGWPDRINEPATVNDVNWRFMLPWRVDTLDAQPDARERQAALREWALRWHR